MNHFKQEEIDEFRECFDLYTRRGQVRSVDELKVIMRSLRLSPTVPELRRYFKQKGGDQMSFVQFLDVMHEHTRREKLPDDLLKGFRQQDPRNTGTVPAKELRRLLCHWGEKLSNKELDRVLREAKVDGGGPVNYNDLVRIVCAPLPDYN